MAAQTKAEQCVELSGSQRAFFETQRIDPSGYSEKTAGYFIDGITRKHRGLLAALAAGFKPRCTVISGNEVVTLIALFPRFQESGGKAIMTKFVSMLVVKQDGSRSTRNFSFQSFRKVG